MGKLFIGVILALASIALVESLVCNKCSASVFGFCLNSGEETCTANNSVCFTGRATFPGISSFSGFTQQGCRVNDAFCNRTINGSLLGVTYTTEITCCSTDKCNPVTLTGGAPSAKMTFTSAIAGAVLASVLGSYL